MVTFEFTPFVLDPAKRVLLRAGVPQTLTPRAFDLLLLLVQQRDRVLSKDEILRAISQHLAGRQFRRVLVDRTES